METYVHELKAKQANSNYRLNSFRLEGIQNIKAGYRLIKIDGLIEDEDFEKKIRQLSNKISGEIKMPTEPMRFEGLPCLAVIGSLQDLQNTVIGESYLLTPEAVITTLDEVINPLSFRAQNDRLELKLARRALDWSLGNAIRKLNHGYWKYDRRFISRNEQEFRSTDAIQVFPGFFFGFIPGVDGFLELSLTPSVCYIERRSLFEKYGQNMPSNLKGRKFLYRYGNDYYVIDAVAVGKQASQDLMVNPSDGKPITIQQHIKDRWSGRGMELIERLDSHAPTIAYKTKSLQGRKAHSQLLFEIVGVSGTQEGDLAPHNESIMNPDSRGKLTEKIVHNLSRQLELFGTKLRPARQMRKLQNEMEVFSPPLIRLADGETLTTNLRTMGSDRLLALRQVGPIDATDFHDEQLFIFGESLPVQIRLDFKKRFCEVVQDIYGIMPNFTNIAVADRNCNVLREQFNAILHAVANRRGYGLLLLPKERRVGQYTDLHNWLKRSLWERLHTQCASVERIMSFYERQTRNGDGNCWIPKPKLFGQFNSYLRFLALGYLEVNRKWLWKLAPGTLRNEVHVGIDVFQDLAAFTFVYGDADLISFQLSRSKRGEKLSAMQVREVVVENLRRDLLDLQISPSTIVFHRDGRAFESEKNGINQALSDLKPHLGLSLRHAIVEIHKTSSARPRLYRWANRRFSNPEMGAFIQVNRHEGFLATTGDPLLRRGTAQPLTIDVVEGQIDIADLAHDIYALSHLAFASPGSAMSLPFTITLADRILRESSPGAEINLYDESDVEFLRKENLTESVQASVGGGVL